MQRHSHRIASAGSAISHGLISGNALLIPPSRTLSGGEGSSFYLITCEHGGNRIPERFRDYFRGHDALLRTHRGYDKGALRMARDFAAALSAPFLASTVSRLLIDLNRSASHPRLYSDATRAAPPAIRQEIFEHYYLPYRTNAEKLIQKAIADGKQVIHLSCHSFTPELDGQVRNADIGLLYDPARPGEQALCRAWKQLLHARLASMRTRLNYPYKGTSDGFTAYLRKQFDADCYLGVELEINQKHVGQYTWSIVRAEIVTAWLDLFPREFASR